MIIAGSGMCTGGRIKHHLEANLGRRESTVLFVGYQAIGTLGRQIQDGRPEVRLFGQMLPVRAKIESIPGFSAHADREELTRWLSGVQRAPRRVFVTHGEPEAAAAFSAHLGGRFGWQASVPAYGESFTLE
jgi:metallo-beta-lactamase family protein